jgi:uncharacterized membrane protein YfhO
MFLLASTVIIERKIQVIITLPFAIWGADAFMVSRKTLSLFLRLTSAR